MKIHDEFKYEKMQTQREKYHELKETLIKTNDKRADQTTEGSVPKLVDDVFTDAISGQGKKHTLFTKSKDQGLS